MTVTPSELFALALSRHRQPWGWTVHLAGLAGLALAPVPALPPDAGRFPSSCSGAGSSAGPTLPDADNRLVPVRAPGH